MSENKAGLQKLVDQAVKALQNHVPPNGLTDDEAVNQFYKIFDGPACWKATPEGTTKERTEPVTLSAKGTRKRF